MSDADEAAARLAEALERYRLVKFGAAWLRARLALVAREVPVPEREPEQLALPL